MIPEPTETMNAVERVEKAPADHAGESGLLIATAREPEAGKLREALEDAREAIRELRLADGHAARTGDETRFDRALAAVCQHENRIATRNQGR